MRRVLLGVVISASCVLLGLLLTAAVSDPAARRSMPGLHIRDDKPQPAKEENGKAGRTYCLLVFGPDAKTRVWLALDGDVLHVGRNPAVGGPAEVGERVEKSEATVLCTYRAGDVARTQYTDLTVTTHGDTAWVSVRLDGGRVLTAHSDDRGPLRFAERPEDAPVVHFGGPLSMGLAYQPSGRVELSRGSEATELFVGVGTPGTGEGSFAFLDHATVPPGLCPVADIVFPPGTPGQPPAHTRVPLSHRC